MSFTARYEGTCGSCYDTIDPGDEVEYTDDGLVHVDCGDSVYDLNDETPAAAPTPAPNPRAGMCTKCWLNPCGCDW
ncbi:hypothetical protein [Mycolicibacterium fortuitum]|uniref:hypothetical protein n=1 Tax=Mycolicibacterium fortuitum TaxID=1766 RepID=UPI0026016FA8|nr:hypothetical protein [Mycolicibacterium fortuitum]